MADTASTSMPAVTIADGVDMPFLGLGTMVEPDKAAGAVRRAIESGYRLIDTAAAYGTEEGVRQGVEDSGIDRSELFLTSKLWFTENSEEGARRGLERTLTRLGTDYLDLYLIHQPLGDVYGAWRGMVSALKSGRVRAIGVDNMTQAMLAEFVWFTDVAPAVNMVDVSVFNQREADRLEFADLGVRMEAWSPLGHGATELLADPTLTAIGQAHGKTSIQVVLRWFVQRGVVAIPATTDPEHMAQNIDVLDFALSDDEMARIAALDRGTGAGGFSMPADAAAFRRMMEWSKQYTL